MEKGGRREKMDQNYEIIKDYLFNNLKSFRSKHSKAMLWLTFRKLNETSRFRNIKECINHCFYLDDETTLKLVTSKNNGEVVVSKYEYLKSICRIFLIPIQKKKEIDPEYGTYPIREEIKDLHLIPASELEMMWKVAKEKEKTLLLLLLTTGWRIQAIVDCKLEDGVLKSIEKGNKKVSVYPHPKINVEEGYVCPTRSARTAHKWVKDLAIKAGIKDVKHIHPHAFRHTYARMLLSSQNTLSDVQKMLGHTNSSTTEKYYVKENMREVQSRINLPWFVPKENKYFFPSFLF